MYAIHVKGHGQGVNKCMCSIYLGWVFSLFVPYLFYCFDDQPLSTNSTKSCNNCPELFSESEYFCMKMGWPGLLQGMGYWYAHSISPWNNRIRSTFHAQSTSIILRHITAYERLLVAGQTRYTHKHRHRHLPMDAVCSCYC